MSAIDVVNATDATIEEIVYFNKITLACCVSFLIISLKLHLF